MSNLRECTAAAIMMSVIALVGCESPGSGQEETAGPAETAGRNLDHAVQTAGDAVGNVTDRTGQAIGDTAITSKIKAAILAEAGLKVMQIHVETADGRVTLSGAADSRADSDRAASIAKDVDGVKEVDNQLVVHSAD